MSHYITMLDFLLSVIIHIILHNITSRRHCRLHHHCCLLNPTSTLHASTIIATMPVHNAQHARALFTNNMLSHKKTRGNAIGDQWSRLNILLANSPHLTAATIARIQADARRMISAKPCEFVSGSMATEVKRLDPELVRNVTKLKITLW